MASLLDTLYENFLNGFLTGLIRRRKWRPCQQSEQEYVILSAF